MDETRARIHLETSPGESSSPDPSSAERRPPGGALLHLRRKLGSTLVETFFQVMATTGRLYPDAWWPARLGVEVQRDLVYRPTGTQDLRLDVYRPVDATRPLPVVLYAHGGGFRILSKDSHWMMGNAFARAGYLVFNIDYRRAPKTPFPGPLEDAVAAFEWLVDRAPGFGGDPSRVVFAGDSAGANLVAALAVATCFQRDEPYARRAFAVGIIPSAVVGASGLYEVTNERRFVEDARRSWIVRDRIQSVSQSYVPLRARDDRPELELANPLLVFESDRDASRPIPPFLLSAGTRDPIIDDTRRLAEALARRKVRCEAWYFDGEPHAFQAIWFRPAAKECWRRTFRALAPLTLPAELVRTIEKGYGSSVGGA